MKNTSKKILLGRSLFQDTFFRCPVALQNDAHKFTFGCRGSGKSTSVIWPNLANYRGSGLVIAPKGEHVKMTYWRRTSEKLARNRNPKGLTKAHMDHGIAYKIDAFNEVPDVPNSYYNLLSEIDINSDNCRGLLSAISDGCVLSEGDKNRHWTEGSKTIIEASMAHVLSKHPPEHRNMPFIHDLLMGFNPDIGASDPNKFQEFLVDMRLNPAAGGLCFQAAMLLEDNQSNAYHNMMSTVQRSIKWMGDPAMRKHLAQPSSFKYEDIGTDIVQSDERKTGDERLGPRTVYIVIPLGMIADQMRWMRVHTNLSLKIFLKRKKTKIPTLVILDEFPRMGSELTAIESGIVTLREQNVTLWPFCQNISQIVKAYPSIWQTFISSSDVQYFGVTDDETAGWVSRSLGEHMYRRKENGKVVQEGARPLYTPEEVKKFLGKTKNRQIVITNKNETLRLERLAFKPLNVQGQWFECFPEMMGGYGPLAYFEHERL